jgi:hypothetical protein
MQSVIQDGVNLFMPTFNYMETSIRRNVSCEGTDVDKALRYIYNLYDTERSCWLYWSGRPS